MPNRTPMVGWHPRPDLWAWLQDEERRTGGGRGTRTALLDEALALLRDKRTGSNFPRPAPRKATTARKPRRGPEDAKDMAAAIAASLREQEQRR